MSRAGSEAGAGRRAARDRAGGFTLIEVLAVVTLVAVLAGVVMIRLPSTRGTAEVASLSHKIASELRNARADAMSTGSERTVVFDIAEHRVHSEQRGSVIDVAPDITIHAEAATSEQRSASRIGVRFFPNGSSTGGIFKLERGQQAHEVRVNWLSGRVIVVGP